MNHISVNKYYITIVADSTDKGLLQLISQIPNVYKARKRNTYHCSLQYLPEVFEVLRGVKSAAELSGTERELYEEELRRRYFTPLLKKHGPSATHPVLWEHQMLGVELAEVNRRYAFFYDTRTGKTLMALLIMQKALKAGKAKRCLVICPSAIIKSWLEDAEKFFPELKVVAYYSTEATKRRALTTPSHIVLWSMEQFVNNMDLIKKFSFDICFVDESSKLKSHKTKISKALKQFSLTIPSWYLLSATPAPNNESEYYTQMMTIDPFIFNPARTKFISKYFENVSRNPQWEKLRIRPYMKQELMDIVEERAIYVEQDVMPVAGKEWHVVTYDMPEYAKLAYNEMRRNMALEVQDKVITANIAAGMRAKLNQITSGFIMDTEAIKHNKISAKLGLDEVQQEVVPLVDGGDYSRVKQLVLLLNTFGDEKVVIWANYRQEFNMIKEVLGSRAHYLHGGLGVATKEEYIRDFKHGDTQYLVCHPLAVGMGINLTEAHRAIYYSLTDSWEALKQSSDRIAGHINVQPNVCRYYVLQAAGTVNELIYRNLQNKQDASTDFVEHLKADALK